MEVTVGGMPLLVWVGQDDFDQVAVLQSKKSGAVRVGREWRIIRI